MRRPRPVGRRVAMRTLALAMAFTVCASAKAWAMDADPERLMAFFEAVALGDDARARIVKWTRPPTIRLETLAENPTPDPETGRLVPMPVETAPAHHAALARVVAALTAETGLALRLLPADVTEGGDIVVTILPPTLMATLPLPGVSNRLRRTLTGPNRCFFVVWPGADGRLRKARIAINSLLRENHINHCFVEELTQTMGLPHDSPLIAPSIFNEASMATRLQMVDRILVRTLYDPRIRPGAARDEIRATAPAVLAGAGK